MAKSVRDAMTANPRSIGASASVVEAARLMREQHIGSLPVTEDDRLVGMITDRDITTRVVAESAVPETTSVGDVYSRDLISVDPFGYVYDCDFNQMLRLPLGGGGAPRHLRDLVDDELDEGIRRYWDIVDQVLNDPVVPPLGIDLELSLV